MIGPALGTYTAVLFSNTAVPTWHEAHRELPVRVRRQRRGRRRRDGARRGVRARQRPRGAAGRGGRRVELAAGEYMERKLGLLGDVYHKGTAATLMKASKACLAAGAVGTVLGRRRRWSAALSGPR